MSERKIVQMYPKREGPACEHLNLIPVIFELVTVTPPASTVSIHPPEPQNLLVLRQAFCQDCRTVILPSFVPK